MVPCAGPPQREIPANWHFALVAQWIEHRFPKPGVEGSIPSGGTTFRLLGALSSGARLHTQLLIRQFCRHCADEARQHAPSRAHVMLRTRGWPYDCPAHHLTERGRRSLSRALRCPVAASGSRNREPSAGLGEGDIRRDTSWRGRASARPSPARGGRLGRSRRTRLPP